MNKVAVIGTGGTISNAGGEPLDSLSYMDVGKVLELEEVLARFPLIHEVAEVELVPFVNLRSKAVGPAEWVRLREVVQEQLGRPDIHGVIITHGTATLEETAYFLHLTVPTQKPIVVVGAQRPASAVSSDAYLNVINALRVAGSPEAVGLGATVVMNDTINSAREVTKSSNHRLHTMQSPELGPLGYVDPDGAVVVYRASRRRHTTTSEFATHSAWAESRDYPRVDISYGYAGADGADVEAFVAAGAQAIIVAGLPPGLNAPGQEEQLVRAAEAGVVVVQSSRAGGSRVVPRPTRTVLADAPTADNLMAQSARVLTQVALTTGTPQAALQRIFDTY